MTYKETLDWLFQQLPMYQRDGKSAYKADLVNTHKLMEGLNHPESKFKSIHIGGTNGKGSVSHMLAALFQSAGYKTGLYTSPHLKDFRERIRINGKMIPESEVTQFVKKNKTEFQAIGLSFFEMTVGMAFDYFANQKVDIALIEVGMGGRLDSTNVINPELSIITNISLDHTAFLGTTKSSIAFEKAGIIKTNTPVVVGENDPETDPVFLSAAKERKAKLEFAGNFKEIPETDLKGSYQQKNVKTVLRAIEVLKARGFNLSQHLDSLKTVSQTTGLRGRWELLATEPRIICDTGHNLAGLAQVVKQLKTEQYSNLRMIWGTMSDKDIEPILEILPTAVYYLCQPNIPRAMALKDLHSKFMEFRPDLKVHIFDNVKSAYKKAQVDAHIDDLIFVGGSTFVVAEIL